MTVQPEIEAEIRRLAIAEKWPIGTIAHQLGVHHSVVERVLERPVEPPRGLPRSTPRAKSTDAYEVFIEETLKQYPRLPASRLFDMLKARDYPGSERTVRRAVARLRPEPQRQAYLRITPLRAEQLQVDWAYVQPFDVPGGQRKLWLFVALLAYSRGLFAEFVLDLSIDSLRRSLRRTGEFFGGHPRQWLFDNAKTVVLERHGQAARFHPLLLDACAHYSVQPRLCAPRRANEKGGVERAIRYLRTRFLAGRSIRSLEQGNVELRRFIEQIAHPRPHPTQPQRTVQDCLTEEKKALLPLPDVPLCTRTLLPVRVDKTAFVRFDTNVYSVLPKAVGRTVTLTADDQEVHVVDGDEEIACHPRNWGRRQVCELAEHRAEIVRQKTRARPAKRMDHLCQVAPGLDRLLERWVEAGLNVGSQISRVQKVFELYGADVFEKAVQAVLVSGSEDVSAIGMHCEQLRQASKKAAPIPVELGAHVPEREVIPHRLEQYDDDPERD